MGHAILFKVPILAILQTYLLLQHRYPIRQIGFIPTGVGAHGLYPSRDGTKLYVANRGTHAIHGKRKGKGRVTVIDFATEKVVAQWPIPGGGSPDRAVARRRTGGGRATGTADRAAGIA